MAPQQHILLLSLASGLHNRYFVSDVCGARWFVKSGRTVARPSNEEPRVNKFVRYATMLARSAVADAVDGHGLGENGEVGLEVMMMVLDVVDAFLGVMCS